MPKPKLGLNKDHVALVKHDPYWSILYAQEASELAKIFGKNLCSTHHIGSTAISTIKAKPVIDLLAQVNSLKLSPRTTRQLNLAGYTECATIFISKGCLLKVPNQTVLITFIFMMPNIKMPWIQLFSVIGLEQIPKWRKPMRN